MNKIILLFVGLFLTLCLAPKLVAQNLNAARIMANPLNLSYRFYTDGVSHRTAADPVIEYFKGKYYLFGSHSDGYFSSPDLKTWTYIHSVNLPAVRAWAPAVMVYEDAIYYMGMGENKIYKSTNPESDQWEEIVSKCGIAFGDPSFFKDDDGRAYIIWGCSANEPIKGMEVDPKDGFRVLGNEVDLLPHNMNKYGWEVPGDNNELIDKASWNEGPCLIKADGLYYLQYATPGTEFTSYSTGVYVSKNPLGPYTCSVSNPFATKPTGFIPGAGHGHTFRDKFGNYWLVGSMILSVRENYERRIGIFPVYFDSDGYMRAQTVFSDFPFVLPDKKVDFKTTDLSAGMNLLSYNKAVKASSSKGGYEPEKATDEKIKTWWSASTGNVGEWFQMDLGCPMAISAIQMNLADEAFRVFRNDKVPIYKYIVEISLDGTNWTIAVDRSKNQNDYVHELITVDKPAQARYIRVVNKAKLDGCFSIYDLRLFGNAAGEIPAKVTNFTCIRGKDSRRASFSWDRNKNLNARYVIRWGTDSERVDNAAIVTGESAEIGLFNVDYGYYFTIEAFNESGIGEKSDAIFVKTADAIPYILHSDQTDKYTELGSSVFGLDITPLVDNDAATVLTTPFLENMYFDVKLSDKIKIIGYSLTAGEAEGRPRSWQLQALSGKNWITIDERHDVGFRPRETQQFTIPLAYESIRALTAYRLLINKNDGGESISITEWQLFGSPTLFGSSITTNGGKITDQYNTTDHEGVQYLIDKRANTKYCTVNKGDSYWMQYVSPMPVSIRRYSLTSANDAPERDPMDWTLEASNDGSTWTVLDTRVNQDFVTRFSELEYPIATEKSAISFTYFRLNVSRIMSGRTFQLAEWQLFDKLSGTGIVGVSSIGFSILTGKNTLTITSDIKESGVYEIFSMTGQSVSKGKIEKGTNVSETHVPGTYLVVLQSSVGSVVKKTVVL